MKEKKKEDKPYLTLEDIVEGGDENKYKRIVKIAQEINRRLDLSPERDNSLIYKVLDELKKGEKK